MATFVSILRYTELIRWYHDLLVLNDTGLVSLPSWLTLYSYLVIEVCFGPRLADGGSTIISLSPSKLVLTRRVEVWGETTFAVTEIRWFQHPQSVGRHGMLATTANITQRQRLVSWPYSCLQVAFIPIGSGLARMGQRP